MTNGNVILGELILCNFVYNPDTFDSKETCTLHSVIIFCSVHMTSQSTTHIPGLHGNAAANGDDA